MRHPAEGGGSGGEAAAAAALWRGSIFPPLLGVPTASIRPNVYISGLKLSHQTQLGSNAALCGICILHQLLAYEFDFSITAVFC